MSLIDNETLPSWDLTQLYQGLNDPQIDADLKIAEQKIINFETKYRSRVADLTAAELLEAIKTDEELSLELGKPGYFLHLLYEAGGSELTKINQKMVKVNEISTVLANKTTFFGVELSKRADLSNLFKQPELKEYSYYLERLYKNSKYILSEEVENVINLKDLSGSEAWGKLFIDNSNKLEVESDFEGELKKYRETDLVILLRDKDRNKRKKAWELLTGALKEKEELALEAYNNILLDKKIEDSLRGFTYPQEAGLISNQLTKEVLDSLITSVNSNLNQFQKFIKLKKEILGLSEMELYDVFAEIDFEGLELPIYSWEDCKKIILTAFQEFNPTFKEIAQKFFENNWIDAKDRTQKKGGAFCSSFGPGFHPVILCTFKGKFEDILTVAHELGHGIHSYLTEEAQSLINSNYTLSTAEIASLCCETIVFDKLIQTIDNDKLKLQLYCNKIEEESGNIFSAGTAYYGFESKAHETFREHGPLDAETIRAMWLEYRYKNLYGDIVKQTENAEYGWLRIHHFVYIFYNYVYASGLLISSSIYNLLQKDHSKIKEYEEVLRLGGSINPVDLLKKLDLDIEDPKFWDLGLDLYKTQVDYATNLWNSLK